MADIRIFFTDEAAWDADLLEHEAVDKGYRTDVIVGIGQQYYSLSAYTIQRLAQDFEIEQESYGYYTPDINLVLVPEASRQQIINTIRNLHESENLFERLKPAVGDVAAKVKGLSNRG